MYRSMCWHVQLHAHASTESYNRKEISYSASDSLIDVLICLDFGAVATSSGREFQTPTVHWQKKGFPGVKTALVFIYFKRVASSCSMLFRLKHVII